MIQSSKKNKGLDLLLHELNYISLFVLLIFAFKGACSHPHPPTFSNYMEILVPQLVSYFRMLYVTRAKDSWGEINEKSSWNLTWLPPFITLHMINCFINCSNILSPLDDILVGKVTISANQEKINNIPKILEQAPLSMNYLIALQTI